MKTVSLPSKIVAITLATLLALMGILPFISSSKAFAEDAELEKSSDIEVTYTTAKLFTGEEQEFELRSVTYKGSAIELKGSVDPVEDSYYYELSGELKATNYKESGYVARVTVYQYEKKHGEFVYTEKGTKGCKWAITQREIEVPDGLTYAYDGTEKAAVEASQWYEFSTREGFGEVTNQATDAGEYKALLKLTDAQNTYWEKSEPLDSELESFADYREVAWSIEQNTELAIVNGDVKWVKGSKDGATLSTNGVMGECESITISNENGWTKPLYNDEEGSLVEGITVEDGSTILVADAAVLESLATGKYTVTFEYNNDNYDPSTVETTLTVAEPTVAKTGDSAGLIALAGLALVAAAGACVVLSMRRRQN